MKADQSIWVAGYPELIGGAGTELLHMIRLWRRHGVNVHLVPMGTRGRVIKPTDSPAYEPHPAMRAVCDALGCSTHHYSPGIFAGHVVVAFCNGGFLAELPNIVTAGRPRLVLWANCMTLTFTEELQAHAAGMIDYHLFQSDYQRKELTWVLEKTGRPIRELIGFHPFYDADDTTQDIRFDYRDPTDVGHFAIGRISRADPSKFQANTWQTFAAVKGKLPTKAMVLGIDDAVLAKIGQPPAELDTQVWPPGGITTAHALSRLHCLIHAVDGSRENWPRVVLEAMAAGVPVIAQRAYGVAEMITDGVTGYLCDDGPHMAAKASKLASDEPRRKAMIYAAREHLDTIAGDATCWPVWVSLLNDAHSAPVQR